MEHVQSEWEKLVAILAEETGGPRYGQAFAAQQALNWVLRPDRFTPPSDYIASIPEEISGCLEDSHPAPSPDRAVPTADAA